MYREGFDIRYVYGHIEVFRDNKFQFSADTIAEALREIHEEGEGDAAEKN